MEVKKEDKKEVDKLAIPPQPGPGADKSVKIKLVKLGDLQLAAYNPRKFERKVIDKIKKSIMEFGFVNPLIINESSNNIVVGGNQRLVAMRELYDSEKEVPVVCLELKEPQEKALNIALNKISSDWEQDKLIEILSGLNDLNIADLSGFDVNELNILDIGVAMPEIEVKPSTSKAMKHPLTFFFDKVEDKMEVEDYFMNTKLGWDLGQGLNSLSLKELIKGMRKKDGK